MKCPKCGYLGFEPADRCRNCGYDFSLTTAPAPEFPELAMRDDRAPLAPLDDLKLVDERQVAAPAATAEAAAVSELPLFGSTPPGDEPLIKKVSPPRTPLAVRRATPEVPRLRASARMPMLDLGAPEAPLRSASARARAREVEASSHHDAAEAAGIPARLAAVIVDLALLAAIDVAVVYLTVQICGLTLEDLALLPKTPLVAFLTLQNGGYLVSFTAGGQTLGKMIAGIRVVSTRAKPSLGFRDSLLRTLVWLVLAVPAGLGLLTAFLTPDRRGLHDRCAGTKVVRATA
jgi:uncharacterized RDD family membrane protein YckC